MCGIAGVVRLNGDAVSVSELVKMTDSIAHRGPDGQGQWAEGNIGLGHRRLAIIDTTSAGAQPMYSADGRHVMVYNGEVYNFKELKLELESIGYRFVSKTDSEVVLNALIEWGVKAIPKFNGMFSLALWDRHQRKLLLARDRYGIKPLYISHQGASVIFASEQKAILTSVNFKRSFDTEGLYEYLTFQNLFTDRTLNRDIQIFSPGHYATLNIGAGESDLRFVQYWDFEFQESDPSNSREEYREELDRLFVQAVNRQLVSDVELGSYLSGGMDSGSISAIASRSFSYLKTFTCGFDLTSASGLELGFDERDKAEAMSNLFKTEHYEIILKAGDMERSLPKVVWHLEEPRVGQSYPNYYAAQLAGRFVKVVLSGTGGDELFGGYPWRYFRDSKFRDFNDYADNYYNYWQRLLTGDEMKSLLSPIWRDVKDIDTKEIFRKVLTSQAHQPRTPNDYINSSLRFEAKTFLHGLLVVEDKLGMAHGLETRLPFLDNELVEFAMRCPIELKLDNRESIVRIDENLPGDKTGNYFQSTGDGKKILREAMSKYLPRNTLDRKKQGFSGPDASWFKGESIEFVKQRLSNPAAPLFNYLDYPTTQILLNQHLEGRQNRRLLIWSLLNLNQLLSQN